MKVNDLLNKKGRDVYSIHPNDTVYNAIAKMADLNIGALVVLDDQELAGIVSERDYRNKVILKGRTSKNTEVREIMTTEVVRVSPSDSINLCMQLMTKEKIRHLPVTEQNKVVGMISIGDVVKNIIAKQKVEINNLRSYIGGGYPS